MPTETHKEDTLKGRMDAKTLELLEKACVYVDLNKSKFIRMSIREKATAILAEQEKTQFTKDDWLAFFELLDNPPKPTKRMRKAARTYRQIMNGDAV